MANEQNTNYFQAAGNTLTALLTPFGRIAGQFANSLNGENAGANYNSWVTAAQNNGAGPNMNPIGSPRSFDNFALGTGGMQSVYDTEQNAMPMWLPLILIAFILWYGFGRRK